VDAGAERGAEVGRAEGQVTEAIFLSKGQLLFKSIDGLNQKKNQIKEYTGSLVFSEVILENCVTS
jgi:hypothetical protein